MKARVAALGCSLLFSLTAACNSISGVNDYSVGCSKNVDCTGDYQVCDKTEHRCVSLKSAECETVLAGNFETKTLYGGDLWKDDNAIILGSIIPLKGGDATTGLPLAKSLALAVGELNKSGIFPSGDSVGKRPLVVVACTETADDSNDLTAHIRAAKHLVNDLHVPAILGAAYSGDTQDVADVATPAGTLVMSPTATSTTLSSLGDLVWRTSPSDAIQGAALVALMPIVEAATKKRVVDAGGTVDQLNVWMINKSDSYGAGLAETVKTSLKVNGQDVPTAQAAKHFSAAQYDDTAAVDIAGIVASLPNIVFLFGTNEAIGLMNAIEAAWPADKPRPTYLYADGGLVSEVWEIKSEDLRKRIFGTVPGTTGALYDKFIGAYSLDYNDATSGFTSGTAAAYDAAYVLGLAIAEGHSQPITGQSIANGLKKLVGGTKTCAPTAPMECVPGINTAGSLVKTTAAGTVIDYTGPSGPLDFDITTGEAPSDIQIWCVSKITNGNDEGTAGASGLLYSATSGTIVDAEGNAVGARSLAEVVKAKCNL